MMSRLNIINPLIRRMSHENAQSSQYEEFALLLVNSYHQQLGIIEGEEHSRAYTAALTLLQREHKVQSLRSYVQSLLLTIYSVKMDYTRKEAKKIPPASSWFDPGYRKNILADRDRLLNACF